MEKLECPVCFDKNNKFIIPKCLHKICTICYNKIVNNNKYKCVICRNINDIENEKINKKHVFRFNNDMINGKKLKNITYEKRKMCIYKYCLYCYKYDIFIYIHCLNMRKGNKEVIKNIDENINDMVIQKEVWNGEYKYFFKDEYFTKKYYIINMCERNNGIIYNFDSSSNDVNTVCLFIIDIENIKKNIISSLIN